MLEQSQVPAWPGIPKNSSEYITLIAHYYRAEMARMSGWRDRIDRTTNWAITVAGAMLSVSLSTASSHHGLLLFAMILVLLLLVIEARRYRFSTSIGHGCVYSNDSTLREFSQPSVSAIRAG